MGDVATRANHCARISDLFEPERSALPPLPNPATMSRKEYDAAMLEREAQIAKLRPPPERVPSKAPSFEQKVEAQLKSKSGPSSPEDQALAEALERRMAERQAALAAASADMLEALSMKEEALARGASEEQATEIKEARLRREIKPAKYPILRALMGKETFDRVEALKQ